MVLACGMPAHADDQNGKKTFTRQYGMAGCGFGSMIVGKSGGQIFAATTNGTAYNQSFAISAGTSNCNDSQVSQVADRMDHFVVANEVALASDIARGSGETLASLASMMKCSNSGSVGAALQGNFKHIFPRYDVQPNEITDSIITTIRQDNRLAQSCKAVI